MPNTCSLSCDTSTTQPLPGVSFAAQQRVVREVYVCSGAIRWSTQRRHCLQPGHDVDGRAPYQPASSSRSAARSRSTVTRHKSDRASVTWFTHARKSPHLRSRFVNGKIAHDLAPSLQEVEVSFLRGITRWDSPPGLEWNRMVVPSERDNAKPETQTDKTTPAKANAFESHDAQRLATFSRSERQSQVDDRKFFSGLGESNSSVKLLIGTAWHSLVVISRCH